jgi:hypothetical protein
MRVPRVEGEQLPFQHRCHEVASLVGSPRFFDSWLETIERIIDPLTIKFLEFWVWADVALSLEPDKA